MNQRPRILVSRELSRRQLLKYSSLAAGATLGSSLLAACGGDDGGDGAVVAVASRDPAAS